VLKERRLWLVLALAAGDAVAGGVALIAAYFVRFRADMIPAPLGIPPMEPYLSLLMLLLPLHALSLRAVGLYEYRHERTKADEAFLVVQGASLATLLLVASTFFVRNFSYSRWVIVLFWVLDVVSATVASSAGPSWSGPDRSVRRWSAGCGATRSSGCGWSGTWTTGCRPGSGSRARRSWAATRR
jgi:hypothetical protein